MKRTIIIMLSVFLSACHDDYPPLTNDQIISETKKCVDAGMKAAAMSRGGHPDREIRKIQCEPKD